MQRGIQVLVVDDEANAREIVALAVRSSGFDVKEAKDGAEALDLVDEFSPSLVLTDVHMPRMDGEQLADRLLQRYGKDCPKLVIATADLSVARRFSDDPRFFAVLTKPLDLESLIRTVSSAIGSESTP